MKKSFVLFLILIASVKIDAVINPFAKWTKTELVLSGNLYEICLRVMLAK